MAATAVTAGILNNGNNCRALNHNREGCNTVEGDYFAVCTLVETEWNANDGSGVCSLANFE